MVASQKYYPYGRSYGDAGPTPLGDVTDKQFTGHQVEGSLYPSTALKDMLHAGALPSATLRTSLRPGAGAGYTQASSRRTAKPALERQRRMPGAANPQALNRYSGACP